MIVWEIAFQKGKKKRCGRKDAGIWRTVGWVPLPLRFLSVLSLPLSPNSLSDLVPPCLPSAPKTLTTSAAPPLPPSPALALPRPPCSSSQAGPPSTASLRSSRVSPLESPTSFLFPTTAEARPRLFASSVIPAFSFD